MCSVYFSVIVYVNIVVCVVCVGGDFGIVVYIDDSMYDFRYDIVGVVMYVRSDVIVCVLMCDVCVMVVLCEVM